MQATGPLLQEKGIAEQDATSYYQSISLANRARAAEVLKKTFARDHLEVLVSHSNIVSEYYATAGFPAITVPLGLDQNGSPIGITLIGKQGQDDQLLAYAFAFEQASKLRVDPD